MYLMTAEQMRQVDYKTITEFGIPEIVLMENAGQAIVSFLQETFNDLKQKSITILAGSGNNGGDGLVAARYLHNLGIPVKVFLHAERELTPSAKKNYEILSRLPVKIYTLDSENSMHLFKVTVNYSDILIDALLGTGINRDVDGKTEQLIEIVNRRSCIKVAVDIPSGLNSNNGDVWGACIHADYTVALAQPKCGHYMNKGQQYCGTVIVKEIGIPQEVYAALPLDCHIIDDTSLDYFSESRSSNSHKGSYGHLLAVGGSMGMSGAITMVSQAAFRSGVGLVSCAVPKSVQMHVAINTPEAMVHPLEGAIGFDESAIEDIDKLLARKDAVVIGPGMGSSEVTGKMIARILQSCCCGIVVDADALNVADEWLEDVKESACKIILTPHPGEMARLTGLSTEYIQTHRLEVAQNFAKENGVWLVLKGANTVVATPEGHLYMNITDSPALAVAGSGDILAGMIGAFLAQGMLPKDACCAAVYAHGCAGRMVEKTIGDISSKAGDIISEIPNILNKSKRNIER